MGPFYVFQIMRFGWNVWLLCRAYWLWKWRGPTGWRCARLSLSVWKGDQIHEYGYLGDGEDMSDTGRWDLCSRRKGPVIIVQMW